jgi:hypothetical protein
MKLFQIIRHVARGIGTTSLQGQLTAFGYRVTPKKQVQVAVERKRTTAHPLARWSKRAWQCALFRNNRQEETPDITSQH